MRKRQPSIWIPRRRGIHATYPSADPAGRDTARAAQLV